MNAIDILKSHKDKITYENLALNYQKNILYLIKNVQKHFGIIYQQIQVFSTFLNYIIVIILLLVLDIIWLSVNVNQYSKMIK